MPLISSVSRHVSLVMVALLAHREGNGQAILRGRQRAGGGGGGGAGRILQAVEVEHQFAGFVEAVVRESGIQEPASAIGLCRARSVPQYEKELGHVWIV